ncbi:hypothetical protein Ade02nite_57500 [Paractinoplanes deccanensis]|uniref:Uncharacterized protein n=1 Tax=Paractinoplanes deccanensis TaxID=113561 RepID=A0ABQ3YAS7_9ACTN|nr:hypothetical protein Ade02nite_57500 [Actinoplanes deccanensis]
MASGAAGGGQWGPGLCGRMRRRPAGVIGESQNAECTGPALMSLGSYLFGVFLVGGPLAGEHWSARDVEF